MDTGGPIPGIKQPEPEVDPFPLSRVEAQNNWSYGPTLSYAFVVCSGTALP